jgi:hypothetical protein
MVTTEQGERVASTLKVVSDVRLPVGSDRVPPFPSWALPTGVPSSFFNWYETPDSDEATWMFVPLPEHTMAASALTVLSAGAAFTVTSTVAHVALTHPVVLFLVRA